MNRNKGPRKAPSVVRNFKKACDDLAELVNEQLFDGCRKWYWIGDVCGGLCDFGDTDFLNPEEMALIILNEVTYEQYAEWREANLDNERKISLQSWLKDARPSMQKDKKGGEQ